MMINREFKLKDILVVDDEADIRDMIADVLKDEGFNPITAANSIAAIDAVKHKVPAAVILDVWLQGSELDGLGILEILKKNYFNLPVIVISGHGNIEIAKNAIKLGAYDFIEKPFKEERLVFLLKRAIENSKLKSENAELKIKSGMDFQFIGKSINFLNLKTNIEKYAATLSRVLLVGANGVGKEFIARIIHSKSSFAKGNFVTLKAKLLNKERLEEELFGYEIKDDGVKVENNIGLFEKASGGTLFIDEITDLSLSAQNLILRSLINGFYQRVGDSKKLPIDFRLIASSSREVSELIKQNKFREDLYSRVSVVTINVPSLSERKEDIPLLAKYFVRKSAEIMGLPRRELSDCLLLELEGCSWPGNIRQLKNIIEWLLIMSQNDSNPVITASNLPQGLIEKENQSEKLDNLGNDFMSLPLRQARELFEKNYLISQLSRFEGNISKTAMFVGMERSAFHRKLKLMNIIDNDEFKLSLGDEIEDLAS